MKFITCFLLLFTFSAIADGRYEEQETALEDALQNDCAAAKEFITAMEYLRTQKHMDYTDPQAQKIAHKVSSGCTGAAQRFIKAHEVLFKVEAGSLAALRAGIDLSLKSDEYTDTFLEIFKKTYLSEYLDLDLTTSLKIARALSIDFKGDINTSIQDYQVLTDFCLKNASLNLSKPKCALISGRVIKKSEKYKLPIAEEFIRLFTFLRDNKSINATIAESLEIAEEIVTISPNAVDNFIYAFKYGVQNKGLALSARKSIDFAYTLSKRTIKGTPADISLDLERLPASKKESTPKKKIKKNN